MPQYRPDREPGHRAVFQRNRLKVLMSQDVCGICGKPVDKSLPASDPMSATVDHIVPVSRGGDPSDIANLQLAHRCCNRAKSDKLPQHPGTNEIQYRNAKVLTNRDLPMSADWAHYKSGK